MAQINIDDINNIPSELTGWGNFSSASQFLIKRLCTITGWPYGELWIPDNENVQMKWFTCWSASAGSFQNFAKFSSICKFARGVGMIGSAWQSRGLIHLEDLNSDFNFLRAEPAVSAGFKKAFAMPLLYNGEPFAVITFFMRIVTQNDKEAAVSIFNQSEAIGKILFPLINRGA